MLINKNKIEFIFISIDSDLVVISMPDDLITVKPKISAESTYKELKEAIESDKEWIETDFYEFQDK
jgi:hypothetical protein